MQNIETLTIDDVARLYHISRRTVHNLMAAGKIPFYKVGRRTLFKQEDLLAFLEQQKVAALSPTPAIQQPNFQFNF